jgi:hypothetical protein
MGGRGRDPGGDATTSSRDARAGRRPRGARSIDNRSRRVPATGTRQRAARSARARCAKAPTAVEHPRSRTSTTPAAANGARPRRQGRGGRRRQRIDEATPEPEQPAGLRRVGRPARGSPRRRGRAAARPRAVAPRRARRSAARRQRSAPGGRLGSTPGRPPSASFAERLGPLDRRRHREGDDRGSGCGGRRRQQAGEPAARRAESEVRSGAGHGEVSFGGCRRGSAAITRRPNRAT